MRVKLLVVGSVLALIAGACGSETPVGEARAFGIVDAGDAADQQVLAYQYQPDSSLTYGLLMDMEMNATMAFPGLGGSGDMSMGMSVGGSSTYDFAPGPQPGSVELTMRSDLSEFDLTHFTVDGQSMTNQLSQADIAALSEQSALPEVTVVLSERGEILELRYGDTAMPADFLSGFGAGGFSDPTGMSMAGLFGPEMPAEGVGVGAEWTIDSSQEVPFLGTLASTTHYWITGQEQVNGHDVLVIVSSSTVEDLEIDLMDMMESMISMDQAQLDAFGMTAQDMAAMQSELMPDVDMTMRFSYDKIEGTTYFDPAAGLVVWSANNADMTGSMDIKTPDGDGSMTFGMSMEMQVLLADDPETT